MLIASLTPDKDSLMSLHAYFKKEMTTKEIIKKHPDEWEILTEFSGFKKELILKRNITQGTVIKEVEKLGFRNVSIIPENQNHYGKYAYLIICTK